MQIGNTPWPLSIVDDQADLAPETDRGRLFLFLLYHLQFIVTQNGTKFSSARLEFVFSVMNRRSLRPTQFKHVAQTRATRARGFRILQKPLKYADSPPQEFEFGDSTETIKMWANGTQSTITLVGEQHSVGPRCRAYDGPMEAAGFCGVHVEVPSAENSSCPDGRD